MKTKGNRSRRNYKTSTVWAGIILSLIFHAALLTSVPLLYGSNDKAEKPAEKIMRVKFDEPDLPKPPEGKLVDVMDQQNITDQIPQDAQFLSDQNRMVEKETQARLTGPNPNSPQSAAGSQAQSQRKKTSDFGKKENLDLSLPDDFVEQDTQRQKTASLSPSNYLPDTALGNETLLNTREYAYASFFIRMKRQMEAVWNPRRVFSRPPGAEDLFITIVEISLKSDGRLRNVRVVKGSGVRALDEEALGAVARGAPYLNPPKDIIEEDGVIRIPHWHFIIGNLTVF